MVLDSSMNPTGEVLTRRAKRLEAYNLFIQGQTYGQIEDALDLPKTTIKRWAKEGRWKDRLARLQQKTATPEMNMFDALVADELQKITDFMRGLIPQRLQELDAACRKGSVTAMVAWLNRAGLSAKGENEEPRRRVLVVRDDLTPAKTATEGEPPAVPE